MYRRQLLVLGFLFILLHFTIAEDDEESTETTVKDKPKKFQLVSFNWLRVHAPFTIGIWLLFSSIAKIIFRFWKRLADTIPDSALLIVLGLVLGYGLIHLHVDHAFFSLDSATFFLYLLPPIIFDAGYFMPNRQLFENFDSVLLFAFIGTIWNTLTIGGSLYLLGQYGLFSVQFSAFEIMLFSALISAVDPVAVIAVFEEIHVNEFLFINVFGEALFNDGASVVLYQMFSKFSVIGESNIVPTDYLLGMLSFFVISLGGAFIGIIFAMLVSIATKFTDRVKILAPVFIFVFPYLSYLTAEMLGLSSILAIVACGIMMKEYVKGNITHDASSSVKYFVKMLAQASETAIFFFLGLSTVSRNHHWDTAFVIAALVACLVFRILGVIWQCALLNRFRTKQFSPIDQFVLSYGGLRGAIAFGLSVSMPSTVLAKPLFVTTTIVVIYFTVFLQGITIRPLLNWLKVERFDGQKGNMSENFFSRCIDYTMAGLEDIAGQRGRHSIRDKYEHLNAKVLKPILMKRYKRRIFDATQIVRAYTRITLEEAIEIANRPRSSSKLTSASFCSSCSSVETSLDKSAIELKQYINGNLQNHANTQNISSENIDTLYRLFSQLLDRKLNEIRENPTAVDAAISTESDIEDDYISIMRADERQRATSSNDIRNSRARLDSITTTIGFPLQNGARPRLHLSHPNLGSQNNTRK
uniref:Sodium/hydrogen exchanger n=2 Tax=Acrobeloides nanus TaxID=290746 RepID=A0A914DQY2_9BILA